ncbi:MAG: methyltransferase domain-containing protein [Actinobacteria bacterium]|uniref:Unannotated protein n=1 Tax=freshwater metagenome TaxID=449393 RepID=A0A6J6NVL7_9ZZZZ|nr:methyltransferase domain-containing protein [Actinomycetota bacterium]
MTDMWSERAELYRQSLAHSEGPDLDAIVAWAEGCSSAIDVATGGGHTARRLREAGLEVVSCDPSPGMRPDVICFAEHLPFADGSFDFATTRVAAHHFADIREAVLELARVARQRVAVVDNLFMGEDTELAERLRDPSHVRNYGEREWRTMLADAGLKIVRVETWDYPISFSAWLERCGCEGDEADEVRRLMGSRVDGDEVTLARIGLFAEKVR